VRRIREACLPPSISRSSSPRAVPDPPMRGHTARKRFDRTSGRHPLGRGASSAP
jgi:hypothetical protein